MKAWFVGRSATVRHHRLTAVILAATVIAMLTGIGQRVIDGHSGLADADHLAAISQVMSGAPERAVPVTFLDVDDKTRSAWRATGATPHSALAQLLDLAAKNGATAMLLDFDLTPEFAGTPGDSRLASFLKNYPPSAPLLLLVKRVRFLRSGGAIQAAAASATAYDADVREGPNLKWIITLNDIGDDRAVRRIKLWQTVCDGASGHAYPSAALAIAAMPDRLAELDTFLSTQVSVECGRAEMEPVAWPVGLAETAQLPFLFADSAAPVRLGIGGPVSKVSALRRISAGNLVTFTDGKANLAGEVDKAPFYGRAVIVGASYSDNGDFYRTPLGAMPGAMILANSIVQAHAIVDHPPVPALAEQIIAIALFLALAWIARTFVGAVGVILLALVVLSAMFVISRQFGFASAVNAISLAVPGFALFQLVDSLVSIGLRLPAYGWRAVLKK